MRPTRLLLLALPAAAWTSERHFDYTQESPTLPAGEREIESWTTLHRGRPGGLYSRVDQRLELEMGVTDRLMTAVYLNLKSETVGVPGTTDTTSTATVDGASWEWKYRFSDPAADPVGFAAYVEGSLASDEAELELKAIADKRLGDVLAAFNLTWEPSVEFQNGRDHVEHSVEADLGVGYFLRPNLSVGIEAREVNEIADGEWEHSSVFVGPNVFASFNTLWFAFSVMPQVAGVKGATEDHLVLDDHERLEVRLLVGMHF
jgi:hypothetical protein